MNKKITVTVLGIVCLILSGCGNRNSSKQELAASRFLEQANLAAGEHRYKEAIQAINKSLAIKQSAPVLALKATWLYRIGEIEASKDIFEKILHMSHISPSLKTDTKNNYACVLNQHGDKKRAAQLWQELTKDVDYLTPEVAHFNLGLLALSQSRFKEAEKELLKATELTPDYIDAYYYLGVLYAHTRQLTKAREKLENVLSFARTHKAAQELLKKVAELEEQELYEEDDDD